MFVSSAQNVPVSDKQQLRSYFGELLSCKHLLAKTLQDAVESLTNEALEKVRRAEGERKKKEGERTPR